MELEASEAETLGLSLTLVPIYPSAYSHARLHTNAVFEGPRVAVLNSGRLLIPCAELKINAPPAPPPPILGLSCPPLPLHVI